MIKERNRSRYADRSVLMAAPGGFTVNAKKLQVNAGEGFIVALTCDIMIVPDQPK